MVKLEPDREVVVTVTESKCDQVKVGSRVYLKGPMVDTARSSPFCMTAMAAAYPWIMASRFGIASEKMDWDDGYPVWCPEKLVAFRIRFREPESGG